MIYIETNIQILSKLNNIIHTKKKDIVHFVVFHGIQFIYLWETMECKRLTSTHKPQTYIHIIWMECRSS